MEPRAHHVLIGLFTVLAVAAAIVSALWLGRADGQSQTSQYTIVFNEAVRGLSQGSAVQYSGINVGSVVDLMLDPDDPRKVLAHIRIRSSVPIKEDTSARLALAGISGASVIELSGGSPESPALVSRNGEPPVIVARRSPISLLLANSDELMTNVSELLTSAQRLLSPDNTQRLSQTLDNIERLTGTLATHDEDIDAFMKNLVLASKQASDMLEQTTGLLANADSLMKNQATRALNSAETALASLEAASGDISAFMHDNQDSLSSGVSGLRYLGPALQELRETMVSIRTVVRRMEDNPANYLLGRDKIQEFTP